MEIYQEVLRIPVCGEKPQCVNITKFVQKIVSRSSFAEGVVLVHTLNTTTGLTKGREAKAGCEATTGYLVQEHEPLLLTDLGEMLDGGAEKFLEALPEIASGRERFLDHVPRKLLDILLGIIIAILRPTRYFKHDDFSIRTDIDPTEKENAAAHLKAAMLRESLLWSFSGGKLNLGRWQSMLFWDFDPRGREERHIQVVVAGER